MTCISVVNRSRLLPDDTCCAITAACRIQLIEHVAPAWDRCAPEVVFVGRSSSPPPGCVPVEVHDDPDIAGLLGYHTEDAVGAPRGVAFVGPILVHEGGVTVGDLSVAAIVSHEAIEAFIDPTCQLWSDKGDGVLVAHEACDPVHGSSYVIDVGNRPISVCNFVLPTWFDSDNPTGQGRYDWLGTLTEPFQLGPRGYTSAVRSGGFDELGVRGASDRPRTAVRRQRHPL